MSSRPRRSAAQRATVAITDMADRDREPTEQRTMSSRSSRRSGNGIASFTRGPASSSPAESSPGGGGGDANNNQHIHLTVKLPSSKLRQATSSSGKRKSTGGSVTAAAGKAGASGASKRTRGGKKSYVIESSEDEDEEEEEEEDEEDDDEEEEDDDEDRSVEGSEIQVVPRSFTKAENDDEDEEEEEEEEDDEQMEDVGEDDAEGDDDGDDMDVDAEGDDDDADADGDIDMDVTPAPRPPAIKITKPTSKNTSTPSKGRSAHVARPVARGTAVPKSRVVNDEEEDDDEELSELESEPEDVTVEVANAEEDAEGDEDEDVDAEGEEEIEVADEDAEGEDDAELLSGEDDLSRADTPDLSKLTARQRAKLGDVSHEYMKLSDEVQAKKHFTAEELSMRRAEMARRRRNLSDKRNEEVKMETINKLLKKQAPKTTRKNALMGGGDETPDSDGQRADPMFVRWVSTKTGNRVGVPDDLLTGPAGGVFKPSGQGLRGKMVEEVS